MKKLYMLSLILALFALAIFLKFKLETAPNNEIAHSRGMSTMISPRSKPLWVITEKGEVFTRTSAWDLGTQSETNVEISKIIDEGSDICALSNPSNYSKLIFAIKTDGTVWQLIEIPDANQYNLEKVSGIENCIKISSGEKHVMALTSDGSVYTWGDNTYGQLGDGTNENQDTPKKIQKLSNIVDISSGSHHCMALSKNGKVYTWGDNIEGQIGNGRYATSEEDRSHNSVYQVKALSDVIQISAGDSWCVALKKDGTVFDWGTRLAVGYCLPDPTKVEDLANIVEISANGSHALALSSSGELWRWGSVVSVPGWGMDLPRKMADFPDAVEIVAGWRDIVITEDSKIWQGVTAKLHETDIDPCYSGKFIFVLSKE